jgi:serine/threonine protein kinase
MKLLRGQSLSSVLAERGKIDPSDVRRILMETASALNYAAKQSVVHRDIKPDNIMLDSEGRCVITDFGIAKAPGGQQTTAGTSLGTPRYMSPEHAMGLPLDGRSDMYSLGVVAYQCLIGKPPFEADEPFAVLYKHIHDPLPEPTLVSDDARQLYTIIARMLAKKPDDRYQDGNELIAALGGTISDPSLASQMMISSPGLMAPTERMPTPKPWSLSRWRMLSRTRKVVWSTVAFAAVATGLTIALDLRAGDVTPPPGVDGNASPAPANASAPKPPLVAGPVVTTLSAVDSAKLAPKPSQRALAILAANKLPSKCPKRDTLATSKPIAYDLLVDSIVDRKEGTSLPVSYDVCGLAAGSPFIAHFTLNKLNQKNPLRRQGPIEANAPASAGSTRSHERYSLDISKASAGTYRLDVMIVDQNKRQLVKSREFRINDK